MKKLSRYYFYFLGDRQWKICNTAENIFNVKTWRAERKHVLVKNAEKQGNPTTVLS